VLPDALTADCHPISLDTVAEVLRSVACGVQANWKTEKGIDHPERDAKFRFVNGKVDRALRAKRPIISVDTKKKERIAN
jgi:hypothetical protein